MLLFAMFTIILSLVLASTQTRQKKPDRAYVYARRRQ